MFVPNASQNTEIPALRDTRRCAITTYRLPLSNTEKRIVPCLSNPIV